MSITDDITASCRKFADNTMKNRLLDRVNMQDPSKLYRCSIFYL